MILLLSSNFSVNVLKFSALFYMYIFLFHDWSFLYVCNLEENLLLSTLILGLVFSDYFSASFTGILLLLVLLLMCIFVVVQPIEKHWNHNLCCGVHSERDHLVLNDISTCDAAFCQNFLTTCLNVVVVLERCSLLCFCN